MQFKRGQVYFCDLSSIVGSEQGGMRPCVIISNDTGNKYSPVIIIAPITSKVRKYRLPTQVYISKEEGFHGDALVICEQIRTIDKSRVSGNLFTTLSAPTMAAIDKAIKISLGVE